MCSLRYRGRLGRVATKSAMPFVPRLQPARPRTDPPAWRRSAPRGLLGRSRRGRRWRSGRRGPRREASRPPLRRAPGPAARWRLLRSPPSDDDAPALWEHGSSVLEHHREHRGPRNPIPHPPDQATIRSAGAQLVAGLALVQKTADCGAPPLPVLQRHLPLPLLLTRCRTLWPRGALQLPMARTEFRRLESRHRRRLDRRAWRLELRNRFRPACHRRRRLHDRPPDVRVLLR